jgi:hypothetical protein
MKLTKMSLVAALLVGSSAFADDKVNTIMDSVKVSGDVNLFYSTSDAKNGMANGLASPLADVEIKMQVEHCLTKIHLPLMQA